MPAREDVSFEVGGETCAAWLYRPAGDGPHPCVVMAHGFGGTRQARLWAYAERFAEAGIAALAFDYRHFGGSSGEPRQLISIRRQLADWQAAIAFARSLERIDPERIALWGTSFSGGHVVKAGADDGRVAAVVAQAPFANGPSALRAAGPAGSIRLTAAALRDLAAGLRGAEPEMLPLVNRPGAPGAMTQPDAYDGYRGLFADPDSEFRNEFAPRGALLISGYFPDRAAARLPCPLLVITAGDDSVTPVEPARRMALRAPEGTCVNHPGWGHFDVYVGEPFEITVAEQTGFLCEQLRVGAALTV